MKSVTRLALLAAMILTCGSACRKESKPAQNASFDNQPLSSVLEAVKGRWRAVYYTGESIAGYVRTPVPDTALGYHTWFYADHITYADKKGDSLSGPVVWDKVTYDNYSLYAFVSPNDRTMVNEKGYAVLSIVNDTLSIGTVNHGIDYGAGILYKKD